MGIGQRRLRLDAIKLNAESILFTSNIPNASSLLYGRDKKGGVRKSPVLESSSFLPLDKRQQIEDATITRTKGNG
jgi:hypothetical protein